METEVYQDILKTIREHDGLPRSCLPLLIAKFPKIPEETLHSILSLDYQRFIKCRYDKSISTINRIYTMYNNAVNGKEKPGIIIKLATDLKISPCLVAKLILLKKYEGAREENVLQTQVSQYLKDTCLIDDKILAYEVFLCTLYDDQYSPLVETMKMYVIKSLGQQYEIRIHRKLTELGLAFRDEEWLRSFGYDKTPDFKMDIPIMIDGFVVYWIESKALFGDAEVHNEYLKNQYSSYWNRFGPGLVIYWFGYLDSITESPLKNLLIFDHFPVNIQRLD